MTNAVKAFIEDNITLIESGDYIKMYDLIYESMYDNQFVRELTNVLIKAGIDEDLLECRDDRVLEMIENICREAISGGESDLHRALDEENNWYGLSIHDIIDVFTQLSYNLGVNLLPNDDKIFKAPNYWIVEL